MPTCRLCGKDAINEILDFGLQPVCHRFNAENSSEEYLHPIQMGQCHLCGLVQLLNPVPTAELIPRYEWLECTEPEDHLDKLVASLSQLPGISNSSKIGGISFKEDSTLERFKKLGFQQTYRLKRVDDLAIDNPLGNIESIVKALDVDQALKLKKKQGQFDILIARHILEHAKHPKEFLLALKTLLKPDGYLVLEIPDCERAIEKYDYTNFWEEHISYFTSKTFYHCFDYVGLQVEQFEKIPYPLEDSYVAIVKQTNNERIEISSTTLQNELARYTKFSRNLETTRREYKRFLAQFKKEQGKIAVFGAAHMACTFINVLELKDYIEFVLDDNPNKTNLLMPGSRLPIVSSKFLLEHNIKLCLLSLSAVSEKKVLSNNTFFIENGGMFKSIFPGNKLALEI